MTFDLFIALGFACFALVYLVFALLRPERF